MEKDLTSVFILSAPGKLLYQLLWDFILCWESDECGLEYPEYSEAELLLHLVPLLAIMLEVNDSESSISSFVLNLLIGGALNTVWTGLFTHGCFCRGPSKRRCCCTCLGRNCSLQKSLSSGALISRTPDQWYRSPPPFMSTISLSWWSCLDSFDSSWSSR